MSLTPDLLTEVCLRAWATDDPRVLPLLRAENQPGRTRRAKAVGQRALAAGWPVSWLDDSRKAATAAVRRLEGMDWSHRGQSRASARRRFAMVDQHQAAAELWVDTGRVSIFDE